MVLLIIIPFLNGYFIGNIPNIFRQTHISVRIEVKMQNKQYIYSNPITMIEGTYTFPEHVG